MVLIDYYSKWIELIQLPSKIAKAVIHVLKPIFATHGIPTIFRADNMPYDSMEFRDFSCRYDFKLVTSSPLYPKSNGLAEKAVGICKQMLKKAQDLELDIYTLLMEYRNTPILNSKFSAAQLLFSRLTKTTLPISDKLLELRIVQNFYQVQKQTDERY